MNKDTDFMNNLSAALVQRNRRESRMIVNVIALAAVWLIVWSLYATLDEITRGMGKIIPSSQIQVVQNLEGGIIEEILVQAGDHVKKGQPLLKIENQRFQSNFMESRLKIEELQIRSARLRAEAEGTELVFPQELTDARSNLVASERKLFDSHCGFLENQVQAIVFQIAQKTNEVEDAQNRIVRLKENQSLLTEQLTLTKPLVDRGIESRTGYLQLQRDMVGIKEKLETSQYVIERMGKAIAELENKKTELRISFRNRARKELNEIMAQITQIGEKQHTLEDQVTRTLVISPVNGIIKRFFVNTIGGVIKPGMDIVEIVPLDDSLLVEVQIKPSDIAFLYPGQQAIIKVTAFDFSIHGGLTGKLTKISADSITDQRGQSYYLVTIKAK
jgi:adhesin transport system membrane fusion protein